MSGKSVEAKGNIGIGFGDSIDVILVRNPLRFLTDEVAEGRLIEGLVVSVSYFEYFGAKKLEEYFQSKGIPVIPMKIKEMRVAKITALLEGFGLISHEIHSSMGEVCEERNKVVHKLSNPDTIDKSKAKEMIEKAIECLEALGLS